MMLNWDDYNREKKSSAVTAPDRGRVAAAGAAQRVAGHPPHPRQHPNANPRQRQPIANMVRPGEKRFGRGARREYGSTKKR
ncbi:MAG: hypothetical protein CM15mP74_25420 [Halieaceae bacterium]|nr:MAG: hypothetical protein CM15mP74_25420 [Halieaceae bacterium]